MFCVNQPEVVKTKFSHLAWVTLVSTLHGMGVYVYLYPAPKLVIGK